MKQEINLVQKKNTFLDTTVCKENDSKKDVFTISRHITGGSVAQWLGRLP